MVEVPQPPSSTIIWGPSLQAFEKHLRPNPYLSSPSGDECLFFQQISQVPTAPLLSLPMESCCPHSWKLFCQQVELMDLGAFFRGVGVCARQGHASSDWEVGQDP